MSVPTVRGALLVLLFGLWAASGSGCAAPASSSEAPRGEPAASPEERDAAQDKSHYHLFNPTPRHLLRPLVTDRPDKTINPVTLDAGHFQLETDLATATFDRRQAARSMKAALSPPKSKPKTGTGGVVRQQPYTSGDKDDYVFLLSNLRVGLLDWIDLHLFLRPLQLVRTYERGRPDEEALGFGDMRALLKENLWGNEGGLTAFALTQYVDIPTGEPGLTTGAVEGGATGAFLLRLPRKLYLGLESGVELRNDIKGSHTHLEVPASISLAGQIVGPFSGKAEFASVVSLERPEDWVGLVALALLVAIGEDWQADVGINLGVTPAANDLNPYVGLSTRF